MSKFGIITDISPEDQPQGSIRFGLNVISKGFDGNYQKYQSEPSNELCFSLKEGYEQIGDIYMENGSSVIFSTNNTDSEIGLMDQDCNYTVLVNANFGFNTNKPITGEYRVKNGCERHIYWGDDLNSDYFFNIDNPQLFKTDGEFDVNKFKFIPDTSVPEIIIDAVNDSGGTLPLGIYRFQVEYVDEKLNTIYRSPISNSVAIYYDNISSSFDSINGNFNIDTYSPDFGGVPNTSKSISLTVNNIDTSIKYLRINVIRSITGDGLTREAYVQNYVTPISDSTYSFTFSGITNDYIVEDVSKLIIPTLKYETSKVREQVQNRYVRANVKESVRDYSNYQRIVNNITSNYVVRQFNPLDNSEDFNSKNPTYNNRTFQSDEIYAFAIVFVFKDGTFSPAFHIPGRAKILGVDYGDSINIPYSASNKEIKHLPVKDSYEYWEVYNTADTSSRMAYFETDTLYPDLTDCNGEPIYGDLAETPVRHHKFPSRKQISLYTKDLNNNFTANALGIEFSNIGYPDSDIVGHYFVYAKRDESNKTVLDSGIMSGSRTLQGTSQTYSFSEVATSVVAPTSGNVNFVNFTSPKSLRKQYINGNYFTFNNKYEIGLTEFIDPNEFPIDNSSEQIDPIYTIKELTHSSTTLNNISYSRNLLLDPNSQINGVEGKTLQNQNYSNTANLYRLNDEVSENNRASLYYVTNKIYKIPYRILENIVYYIPTNNIYTLTDEQTLFSGDAFISQFNFFGIIRKQRTNDERGHQEFFSELLRRTWVESDINYDLIHGGINDTARLEDWYDEETIKRYILDKVAVRQTNGRYVLRINPLQESYYYNKDYSDINSISAFFSIPNTYNYCSKCLNEHKTRIIFSPKSFDEEIADFYRINFSEDYIELPSHRGEITGLQYKNNQLIVHTTQTTFILQPNPQFINTDQNSAYLTTGDFLSIPPYEIMQTDVGYGGMQNILASSNSEGGYIWIDSRGRTIFSLSNNFKELNTVGISEWLFENLPVQFFDEFRKVTKVEYPFKDTLGVRVTYDPRFSRLIISKKDYKTKVTPKLEGDLLIRPGDLVFTTNGQFYIKTTRNPNYITLDNESFFCNKSFTLSYSFDDEAFISYHSYLPDYLFETDTNFFSTIDNKVYKHLHKGKYLSFYENSYPFIIEQVSPDYLTKNLNAIYYYADFERLTDNQIENLADTTYNKAIFYNSRQSSGLVDLKLINQQTNPYSNIKLNNNEKSVIITDKNAKISNLWDNSTATINFLTDCPDSGFGFIDKVPINIDTNKSAYSAGQFSDKYLISRLFYFPDSEDIRVVHKLSIDNSSNSIR